MGWNVVKQDERYVVTDNDTLKKLITSTTELNPSYSTTGHSHKGQEEVYIFRSGKGEMQVNESRFKVKEGDIIFIEDVSLIKKGLILILCGEIGFKIIIPDSGATIGPPLLRE